MSHELSASQIQVFLECPRKWWFQYVAKEPRTESASARLGTETHALLEEYFDGKPLDYTNHGTAASIAQAGLEFLPPIGACHAADGIDTEHEFLLKSPKGHRYYGLIDLRDRSTRTIYDHKTTSNLKWALTPAGLQSNVQAILYATTSFVEWGFVPPEINLQWTYMQTRGRRLALPVRVTLSADHVGKMFDVVEDVADEIASLRGTKRHLDLAPNPHACEKYGGCPFRHLCNLSPSERLTSVMAQETTADLLARLARQQNQTTTSTPTPGQVNPPEGANAPPPPPDPEPTPAPEPTTEEPPKAKRTRKAKETGKILTKQIGTLYVDCFPISAVFPYAFENVVAQARDIIRATTFRRDGNEYKINDYREAPYGMGPAILLSAVEQVLANMGPIDAMFVTTATPEFSACFASLVAMSDLVIRSVR